MESGDLFQILILNLANKNSKQIANLKKKNRHKNPCLPVTDIGRRA
jgi:hypothetical protein